MSLGFGISRYINFNSKEFSLKLFNQRLPFIYIFFNALYRKLIVNKNIDNNILKFHNSGFTKLNVNVKDVIDEYKDKFFVEENNENKVSKKKFFSMKDLDKKNFIKEIKDKLRPSIEQLERYFNCEVAICDVKLTRNYHHEDQNNLDVEHYNNHFHQDSYLMTYNKIFINLMDITEDDGPLEIVPDENKNSFIKSFNFKDRHNYSSSGDTNLIYKNTGKKGDCFLFSSPRVFHRAGVPKNYRDNMVIIITTIPKYKHSKLNIEDESQLFGQNYKFFQKFTKPYSIVKVIKLFVEFYKYKSKRN
jgi:hypothetical protein